jgi:hypothetical protein
MKHKKRVKRGVLIERAIKAIEKLLEPPPTIDENQNITLKFFFWDNYFSLIIKSFKIHTMKSLFLKLPFLYLRNFRTINKFKTINTKLHKTIEDREVDRIILKGQIIKMVRKYLNIGAKSDSITNRNTTEIRRVLAEFGEQMNKLGIRINAKLD